VLSRRKFIAYCSLLLITLLVLFGADLYFGHINLFDPDTSRETKLTVLYQIRLPKAITSMIAGSLLAVCGLLLQSLFRNPLAGPYVLGISSGSSLFVAITTMILSTSSTLNFSLFGKSAIVVSSVCGALLVTVIILSVAKKTTSNITILLIGLMLSQIFGAIQSLVEYWSSSESLKAFVLWGMGSVSNTTINDLYLLIPFAILLIIASLFFVKPLNAILLNEQYAQNLGINLNTFRYGLIIITSLMVGLVTAFCGPIAFVGISVPIATRLLFKISHHFQLIILNFLIGAIALLFADVICQILSTHITVPINTITTLLGSPIVIYLLFKSKLSS
jgi:iron complex transport system permease protein